MRYSCCGGWSDNSYSAGHSGHKGWCKCRFDQPDAETVARCKAEYAAPQEAKAEFGSRTRSVRPDICLCGRAMREVWRASTESQARAIAEQAAEEAKKPAPAGWPPGYPVGTGPAMPSDGVWAVVDGIVCVYRDGKWEPLRSVYSDADELRQRMWYGVAWDTKGISDLASFGSAVDSATGLSSPRRSD